MKHPLTHWRDSKGFSRSEFARAVGVVYNTVRRWESYQLTPNRSTMPVVVSETGLSPADFYPPPAKLKRKRVA